LDKTPVLWGYRPVRKVARDGQHSGSTAKALSKRSPRSSSSARVFGIASRYRVPSSSRSSTSTNTKFGCLSCTGKLSLTR